MYRDIVIIGAGCAGLVAALEAAKNSETVTILEKREKIGGNSIKATSGINLLNTEVQKKHKVKDSFSIFIKDSLKSGKFKNDYQLIATCVRDSIYLYDYLKNIGVDLPELTILGGHLRHRTHRPKDESIGKYLIEKLMQKISETDSIRIIYKATACELVTNFQQDQVTGVKYYFSEDPTTTYFISCKATIISSGGFAHSKDMINKYAPHFADFPTTNGPGTLGEGIKIAKEIGANIVHIEKVQLHPTGFINPKNKQEEEKILAPEALRGMGGILVHENGERFCNELDTRDAVSKAILGYCLPIKGDLKQYVTFLIVDERIAKEYGERFNFYTKKLLMRRYESVEELCKNEKINLKLKETINNIPKKLKPPLYAGLVTPCVHYCMGGLQINANAQVLKGDRVPIIGLYAAGEVVGGIHGENRLGGNSLLDCITFGRRAGVFAGNFTKCIENEKCSKNFRFESLINSIKCLNNININ